MVKIAGGIILAVLGLLILYFVGAFLLTILGIMWNALIEDLGKLRNPIVFQRSSMHPKHTLPLTWGGLMLVIFCAFATFVGLSAAYGW